MKVPGQTLITIAATLAFGLSTAYADSAADYPGHAPGAAGHGPMMGHGMGRGPMGGPTAMLTKQDASSSADMGVVMDLVHENAKIRRTVTNLPDGIRTVTESDDLKVAQSIKAHVASMSERLKDGREFNLFSPTLPVIFANAAGIRSSVEMTSKGVIVTRTSTDRKVVAALQSHASEVSELVRDGMAAMHRGMMTRMSSQTGAANRMGNPAPAQQHGH